MERYIETPGGWTSQITLHCCPLPGNTEIDLFSSALLCPLGIQPGLFSPQHQLSSALYCLWKLIFALGLHHHLMWQQGMLFTGQFYGVLARKKSYTRVLCEVHVSRCLNFLLHWYKLSAKYRLGAYVCVAAEPADTLIHLPLWKWKLCLNLGASQCSCSSPFRHWLFICHSATFYLQQVSRWQGRGHPYQHLGLGLPRYKGTYIQHGINNHFEVNYDA